MSSPSSPSAPLDGATTSSPNFGGSSASQIPQLRGYQILAQLGEGGMGVVWKAVQLSTHRTVALKLMSAASLGSPKAHHRFQREVELAAALDHPHIAHVYDSGLDQGLCYYAMELVDGVNLRQFVQDHPFTLRQILELFLTICQAIQHAHQHGVIHRDLKPLNILITPAGIPKVLDFGLAKTLTDPALSQDATAPDHVAGTPAYMAPEQAAGFTALADTRADVYSLGKILFELLTHHPAHDLSGSTLELLKRIATEDIRRPRALNPKLDRELEAILLKALAHDPAARYSSAGELAADLQRYLHHEPVSARSHTILYFASRRLYKRRKPILIVSTVLALLAALMGYYGYEYYAQQSGWNLVASCDFTRPNPDLGAFEFVEWTNSESSYSWPVSPEGLMPIAGYWCWLKDVRSRGDLRVVARVRFSEHPDTFAIALHGRTPCGVPTVYHLPPGYISEFATASGTLNLLTAGNQPGEPDQGSGTPAAFAPSQRATLTFQRLDSTLSLQVDSQPPVHYTQLLPLSGPNLDRIGFRTWDRGLRIESIAVYRRSLPRKANPVVAGDALIEAGDLSAALRQYTALAADYANSSTGELALAKACRTALLPGVADPATRAALYQRFLRDYPTSSFRQDLHEAQALTDWTEQRYDDALRQCDDILRDDPDSRLALRFARSSISQAQPLTPHRASQLLARIARTTRLTRLNISGLGVDDLSPLRSLKLVDLAVNDNAMTSLEPLAGMPLHSLEVSNNRITSLEPLRGMPLSRLVCNDNPIPSLEPLHGMPLEYLHCEETAVGDLEPLRHMPLRHLSVSCCPIASLDPLRDLPDLTEFYGVGTSATSLEPLRSLRRLVVLWLDHAPIESLEPLRQCPLREFYLSCTPIRDIQPLRDMPLEVLIIYQTQVTDLSPLEKAPLRNLSCDQCTITTLEPLRGLPLRNLSLNGTQVHSLELLRDLPNLQKLSVSQSPITSLGPLVDHPPPDLAFESDSLPEAELERALATWSTRPETQLLARDARLLLALRHRDANTLRSLATTLAGHQYLYVPRFATWAQAQTLCESVGGHLMTFSSPEEIQLARTLAVGPPSGYPWIGLHHRAGQDLWFDGTPNQVVPPNPYQPVYLAGGDFPYLFMFFSYPSPWIACLPTSIRPFLLEWDSLPPANPASQPASQPK